MFLLLLPLACTEPDDSGTVECGPGTHLDGATCVPDTDTDTDTDADSDTDTDTDSDTDTDTDTDTGSAACDVAPDGTAAFRTVQEALDAAADGDTIRLCAGTYREDLAAGDSVTIEGQGDGPADVVLEGSGAATVLDVTTRGPFTLRNLTVSGGGGDVAAVRSLGADLALEQVWITSNTGGNAVVDETGGSFRADGLTVEDNEGTVILHLAGDVTLVHALVRDNLVRSDGNLYAVAWLQGPGDAEITNSLFYGNTSDVPTAALFVDEDSVRVQNSVFYASTTLPVIAAGSSYFRPEATPDFTLENDVLDGNGVSGSFGVTTVPGADVFAEYTDFHDLDTTGTTTETACLDVPPDFADAEAGDFRLSAYSPLLDAGNPAAAYNDADGSRNDVGAYGGPNGDWTP